MATAGKISRNRSHDVEEITPPSDWSEDLSAHYLLLDLPGFKLEEVRLEVDSSGHIIISGERLVHNDKYEYFEQKFKLPENADIDNISGQFEGELLNVTVPKQVAIQKKQPAAAKGHKNEDSVQEEPNNNGEMSKHDGEHGDEVQEEPNNNGETSKHDGEHGDEVQEEPNNNGETCKHDGEHHDHEKKGTSKKNSQVDCFHKEIIKKWGQKAIQLEMPIMLLEKNKMIIVTAILAFSLGVFLSRRSESNGQ